MAFLDDQSLQIIISAKDEATKVIKGIEGTIKDMGPVFGTMAKAGTAALTAIGGAAVVSLKAADESMKVQAQLGAVLKSTGNAAGLYAQDILDQAAALQKQTTFSDEAVTSGANLLLTFKNIKGAVFQEALPALLDMSTAMGTDLKSSAIQVGKALNDPIAGISALSRVGVTFSQDQQDVIAKLVETGDVAAAQRIILAELNSEFGGSAAAAAQTFGGQLEQLKNSLGDIGEEIGMVLIPWVQQFTAKVRPVVDAIIAWVQANPELAKNIIITTVAIAALVTVIGTLGLLLPVVISGFAILASPVTLVVLAITALAAAAIIFRDRITEILNFIDQKTGLVTLFKWAWDNIVTTFNETLLPALSQLWEALKPLEPLLSLIAKVIGGLLLGAVYGITLAITGWIQIITAIIAAAAEFSAAIINYFVKPIESFIDVVKKAVEWVSKLINKMGDIGVKNLGKKAISGISSILGFEHGGLINAPRGTAVPIIAHGQERIIPAGHSAGGNGGGNFSVVINNPQVRSNDDVREMRKQMEAAWRDVTRGHKLTTI